MTRTEELIQKSQAGDREAGEALIQENAGLIWAIARRFLGRGAEAEDLYQLGCLGFLKAVEGFDLTFGTQFSTYAVPKIAGEIRRFLRDDGTIKVSRSLKEQAAQIKSARNLLASALGREPTVREIGDHTGLTAEQIALAESATAGNADAIEVYNLCGEKLGYGLSILIDILNPETIVIGSIFERCENLLRAEMEKKIKEETLFASRQVCKVVPAALTENIGDIAALSVAAMIE